MGDASGTREALGLASALVGYAARRRTDQGRWVGQGGGGRVQDVSETMSDQDGIECCHYRVGQIGTWCRPFPGACGFANRQTSCKAGSFTRGRRLDSVVGQRCCRKLHRHAGPGGVGSRLGVVAANWQERGFCWCSASVSAGGSRKISCPVLGDSRLTGSYSAFDSVETLKHGLGW